MAVERLLLPQDKRTSPFFTSPGLTRLLAGFLSSVAFIASSLNAVDGFMDEVTVNETRFVEKVFMLGF
jgi:hypothetical protein